MIRPRNLQEAQDQLDDTRVFFVCFSFGAENYVSKLLRLLAHTGGAGQAIYFGNEIVPVKSTLFSGLEG